MWLAMLGDVAWAGVMWRLVQVTESSWEMVLEYCQFHQVQGRSDKVSCVDMESLQNPLSCLG